MEVCHSPARVTDLDVLTQFVKEFYECDHHPFQADIVHRTLKDLIEHEDYGRIWLIMVDEVPVGYVVLTLGYSLEYHGRDAFVDEIFLREPYRGKGVGSQTFAFLEAECRKLGVKAVHLEVMPENELAYEFYCRLGYGDRQSSLLTKWL